MSVFASRYSSISANDASASPAASAARMRRAFAARSSTASRARASCESHPHTTFSRMFFAMRRSPVKWRNARDP